ncbi:MAG: hypothetical protein FWG10_04690 [Eubacteriaceae bacterium]|nr:hypothetical protein [Eubacteriaceae bacterium]
MKKSFAIALAVVLAFSLLAACGGGNDRNGNGGGNNSNSISSEDIEELFDFNYDKNFLDNNLKGDFSITYKMIMPPSEDSEGGEMVMTFMRTSEGYYMSFGEEGFNQLALDNGDTYDIYMDWGDGEGYREYGNLTKEEIEQSLAFIGALDSMSMYESLSGSKFKKAGTETIAGRSCDKYSVIITSEEVSATLSFSFDQQTGVFMKSVIESPEGAMIQECTEFKTSGVALPSRN